MVKALLHPFAVTQAHTQEMSGAFVREVDGEQWIAPAQAAAFRVVWAESGDVLREDNDLSVLIAWALSRPEGTFEVRRADGTLQALISSPLP